MATITHVDIIVEALQSGGSFRGDPVPAYIYSFTPVASPEEENYAVFYRAGDCDIHTSPYVLNPVCLFDGAITPEGEKWLKNHGNK
ncbi:MAG: hypothetical protein ACXAC5_01890 [Promethearchaeota archaeon]